MPSRIFRRAGAIAAGLLATTVLTVAPAHAAPHSKPRTTILGVVGPTGELEGEREWELLVDAVDPDGVVWEVEVWWDDHQYTWASTFCLQGPEPGTVVHMRIPHSFATTGRHLVRARTSSFDRCFGGADSVEQVGRWTVTNVDVRG